MFKTKGNKNILRCSPAVESSQCITQVIKPQLFENPMSIFDGSFSVEVAIKNKESTCVTGPGATLDATNCYAVVFICGQDTDQFVCWQQPVLVLYYGVTLLISKNNGAMSITNEGKGFAVLVMMKLAHTDTRLDATGKKIPECRRPCCFRNKC